MMKGIRRNQKGTVLLTVLCFTTMCMVIAAIALRVSNKSNEQSTDNVMRSQAQITAEHYLEQYLSTFPTELGADGQPRYNYDELKKIAGASEDSPATITIKVKQKSGTSEVNVSNAALTQTEDYGGNCTIYVYKQGSGGIVVKSVGDYNGQTGLASAYFYGETPSANLNKNAIETCGGYDVADTACVNGDILLSNPTPGIVTKFKNNNGAYHTNFKTNGKLMNNNEDVRFRDTLQGNAPTITAEGEIYFYQLDIATDVGKTDQNGKHATDSGYDASHLLNKNGYINTDKKIILEDSANKIGRSGRPIDIYCRGAIIGLMPSTAYGTYSDTDVYNYKQAIEGSDSFNRATHANNSGDMQLYGNIYCYRGIKEVSIANDGDFIVNTQNSLTINGDLVVQGNIYVNGATLRVTGNLYCTGSVHGTIMGTTGAVKTATKSMPSDARALKPFMDYSPGLYVYGDPDFEDPKIYSPQNYKEQSPFKMYQQNDVKSKYFKDNFLAAVTNTLSTPGVATGYTDDNVANKEITINKSCRLSPIQANAGTSGGNDGAKYTVNVQDKDIWILLPATPGASNEYRARFRVNNPKNGHHCYFVFYNTNGIKEDGTIITDPIAEDGCVQYYYITKAGFFDDSTTVSFMPNLHGEAAVFTSEFAGWNDQTPTNQDAETNIVYLIPDDFTFNLGGNGMYSKYHAVYYGPGCLFNGDINTGNKVYGQVKVNYYDTTGASNIDESAYFCDLSKSSILHSFLTQGAAAGGTLNLQYYVRHK